MIFDYLRPEENYPSVGINSDAKGCYSSFIDHLIQAIKRDISIAREKLATFTTSKYAEDLLENANKLISKPG
jgi:hypothetical protein